MNLFIFCFFCQQLHSCIAHFVRLLSDCRWIKYLAEMQQESHTQTLHYHVFEHCFVNSTWGRGSRLCVSKEKRTFLWNISSTQPTNTYVLASRPSTCHFPHRSLSRSRHTPSQKKKKTFSLLWQRWGDTFRFVLLSFSPPLHLLATTVLRGAIVSDMRCNTSVNGCWLFLWVLLWGGSKITGLQRSADEV